MNLNLLELAEHSIIQEINSLTFVQLERPEQLEFIDFVEAEVERSEPLEVIQQIDQSEETESLELAQAVFVEREPELHNPKTILSAQVKANATEKRIRATKPEESKSLELAHAVFIERESEREPEPVPELHYTLPIERKKDIKNFNTILKSETILSAQVSVQ